jgi:hypothetical protein
LIDRCTDEINKLLHILNGIIEVGSGSEHLKAFKAALNSLGKDEKIHRIKSEIYECAQEIMYLLHENNNSLTASLRGELMAYHQGLESQMTLGFKEIHNEVLGSQTAIMDHVKNLITNHETALLDTQVDLIIGQEDLRQAIERIRKALKTLCARPLCSE